LSTKQTPTTVATPRHNEVSLVAQNKRRTMQCSKLPQKEAI